MKEGIEEFARILESAIEINCPSRYYTLELTNELYNDTNGCCIGSLFGINKIEYDLLLKFLGIYICGKSARVKVNTKVCDLLFSFSDALSRNVSYFKVGNRRNCVCIRLGKKPFEIPCQTERNRFASQISERLGVPTGLENCAIFKACTMKITELLSTFIKHSSSKSIDTKVRCNYTCEGIRNVKRLTHIQKRNRDFEEIKKIIHLDQYYVPTIEVKK